MAALINPDLPLPADVRRRVSAEGSARWSRAVSGGRVLLETRRVGSRLVTEGVGVRVETSAPALFDLCPAFDA